MARPSASTAPFACSRGDGARSQTTGVLDIPPCPSAHHARSRDGVAPGVRRSKRSRTVFRQESPFLGTVRVIEDHRERRLMVHGETLSVYPTNGDWSRVRKEYWWHALAETRIP